MEQYTHGKNYDDFLSFYFLRDPITKASKIEMRWERTYLFKFISLHSQLHTHSNIFKQKNTLFVFALLQFVYSSSSIEWMLLIALFIHYFYYIKPAKQHDNDSVNDNGNGNDSDINGHRHSQHDDKSCTLIARARRA